MGEPEFVDPGPNQADPMPAGATFYASHPGPPPGDAPHRYIFTVYALDVPTLSGPDAMTTGARVIFSMRGHLLAQGSITGKYGRSG